MGSFATDEAQELLAAGNMEAACLIEVAKLGWRRHLGGVPTAIVGHETWYGRVEAMLRAGRMTDLVRREEQDEELRVNGLQLIGRNIVTVGDVFEALVAVGLLAYEQERYFFALPIPLPEEVLTLTPAVRDETCKVRFDDLLDRYTQPLLHALSAAQRSDQWEVGTLGVDRECNAWTGSAKQLAQLCDTCELTVRLLLLNHLAAEPNVTVDRSALASTGQVVVCYHRCERGTH